MVFQFEHVDLDSGPGGKWDLVPMTSADLMASLARWQEGMGDVGWNSLYLGNHDQPRCVSRFGDDSPEHRVRSAKALATVLHLHRGTPYIYQGDELGMTNAPFRDIHDTRDIESHNAYRAALARGMDARAGDGRDPLQGPRQRADPDAVGRDRARRLHHRLPVDRGAPRLRHRERGGAGRRPRLRARPTTGG